MRSGAKKKLVIVAVNTPMKADPTAAKFISPIANIVGAVGEMVLEQKRDTLIAAGIQKGEGPVNEVLGLVRDDMDTVFNPQVRTGEAERFATLVTAYNTDRSRLNYEQRKARLEEIKVAQRAKVAVGDTVPSALVTSMMDAHAALVELARSPDVQRTLQTSMARSRYGHHAWSTWLVS